MDLITLAIFQSFLMISSHIAYHNKEKNQQHKCKRSFAIYKHAKNESEYFLYQIYTGLHMVFFNSNIILTPEKALFWEIFP